MFHASATHLPTLEQLFIDAEMALGDIPSENNRKTYSYGLYLEFPLGCTSGALEIGCAKNKYGPLCVRAKDHSVD
jgi:hypothetical protein